MNTVDIETGKHLRLLQNNGKRFGVVYLVIFGILLLRLGYLQLIRGGWLRERADMQHQREEILPASRGQLLDCTGKLLAYDDARMSLNVDPVTASKNNPEFQAQILGELLQMPTAEVLATLTKQSTFNWVKRDLLPAESVAIGQSLLPNLQVVEDGKRYAITIDTAQLPRGSSAAENLALALGIKVEDITAQLGDINTPPIDGVVTGEVRRLNFSCNETVKAKVKLLKFKGITFDEVGLNYSLGVNPSLFNGPSAIKASDIAPRLAPILGMEPDKVEQELTQRLHFAPLAKNLDDKVAKAVSEAMATIYVLQPGAILQPQGHDDKPTERFEKTVTDLTKILNKTIDTKNGEVKIDRSEVAAALAPGAKPGAFRVFQQKNGKPYTNISYFIARNHIPGVMYGLPGLVMTPAQRRIYPYNSLAAPSLGYMTYTDRYTKFGVFGLEKTLDKILTGKNGKEYREVDVNGSTIPLSDRRDEPVNGRNVQLTIDLNIQQAAEEELAKAVQANGALRGHCIVMDPKNGDILAIASNPTWDANDPGSAKIPLVNTVLSNVYEPGSTYKLVASMASLDDGLYHDGQIITNCTGSLAINNKNTIHEPHNAHGPVDIGRLLEQSCNIGAATLAMNMGSEKFLGWCERLGFGERTGIELEQEAPGSLNRKAAIDHRITLANMGFGQSIAVTPLQMAALYGSVANKGVWVQPHLVKGTYNTNGKLEPYTPVTRTVCKPETASQLSTYLERVVTKGTGNLAAIPGYRVGGKTGTAQKPGEQGYHSNLFIASFVGFMPVQDPRLVIICVIDEPKGSIYGGAVAAPVVREVGRRALQYLNVLPTEPVAKP
ncbi:MAG: penicillin-binding transpeptidase domain-containing protein, partial [bacterium]